jgi:hypothetical protein
MARRVLGGYAIHQEITRGKQAIYKAREALRRIVEEKPGPQTEALLIAKIAIALGEIESVLNEVEQIGRQAKEPAQ